MANKLKELVERMTSTITIGSIRQIAKVSLLESPKYFWTIPSSSSGKYHPVDELVKGGLVIHTLKALYVFETLAPSLNGLNENSPFTGIIEVRGADCIRCAILLHDTYKNGIENCGHTIHEHPLVAANELRKRFKEVPVDTETIAKLIESHMGSGLHPRTRKWCCLDPKNISPHILQPWQELLRLAIFSPHKKHSLMFRHSGTLCAMRTA